VLPISSNVDVLVLITKCHFQSLWVMCMQISSRVCKPKQTNHKVLSYVRLYVTYGRIEAGLELQCNSSLSLSMWVVIVLLVVYLYLVC
jgi:hypothetical protein